MEKTTENQNNQSQNRAVADNTAQFKEGNGGTLAFVDNRPETSTERLFSGNFDQREEGGSGLARFVDNRPETAAQLRMAEIMRNSPQAKQAAQMKAIMQNSPHHAEQNRMADMIRGASGPVGQREAAGNEASDLPLTPSLARRGESSSSSSEGETRRGGVSPSPLQGEVRRGGVALQREANEEEPAQMKGQLKADPVQKKENETGMPDGLKCGLENLSGISMDHVKVHYNSPEPAQLNAHAFTQGSDIHVASGQEKHIAHEGWHVVQQAQGRVLPTMQMAGTQINDDAGLEKEADVMGGEAASVGQRVEGGGGHEMRRVSIYPKENKSREVATSVGQKKNDEGQGFGIVDNRGEENGTGTMPFSTIQRAIEIGAGEKQIDYFSKEIQKNYVDEYRDEVIATLKSWIDRDKVISFDGRPDAVRAAINAVREFGEEGEQDLFHQGELRLGAKELFFSFYEDFGLIKENFMVGYFIDFSQKYSMEILLELSASAGSVDKIVYFMMVFDSINTLVGEISVDHLKYLINRTDGNLNDLFQDVTVAQANQINSQVLVHLNTITQAQRQGIAGQWVALRQWLTSTQNIDTIIALVAGGYTYQECGGLAKVNLSTPQYILALQPQMQDYNTIDQYIEEAQRFDLSFPHMIAIASMAAAGSDYATLQPLIPINALNQIDKVNEFRSWINALKILIAKNGYTITIGLSTNISSSNMETWERKIQVYNAVPNLVDSFVVHYHPGAEEASTRKPNDSPRHLKSGRGGNIRIPWDNTPPLPGIPKRR